MEKSANQKLWILKFPQIERFFYQTPALLSVYPILSHKLINRYINLSLTSWNEVGNKPHFET